MVAGEQQKKDPFSTDRLLGVGHGKNDALEGSASRRLSPAHAYFMHEGGSYAEYDEAYRTEWQRVGKQVPK